MTGSPWGRSIKRWQEQGQFTIQVNQPEAARLAQIDYTNIHWRDLELPGEIFLIETESPWISEDSSWSFNRALVNLESDHGLLHVSLWSCEHPWTIVEVSIDWQSLRTRPTQYSVTQSELVAVPEAWQRSFLKFMELLVRLCVSRKTA